MFNKPLECKNRTKSGSNIEMVTIEKTKTPKATRVKV